MSLGLNPKRWTPSKYARLILTGGSAMRMSKKTWIVALLAAGVGAQGGQALATDWSIGAGVGVAPDYEGSDDYEPVPLWNLRAQDLYDPNTFVRILGLKLDSNLLPHDNFRLGLSAEFALERDDVDDNQVDDLGSTDDGLLVGAMVGYDFNSAPDVIVGVELDGRFDPTGDIGGLVTLRGKYQRPLGAENKWILDAGVETTYASDDYMDNYFSISAGDAANSGLSAFEADDGIKDVGFSAGITYRFSDRWSLSGLASYNRLLGDAADSPVTDDAGDENQFFGGALINFRF